MFHHRDASAVRHKETWRFCLNKGREVILQAIFTIALLLASSCVWAGEEKDATNHPSKVPSIWFELLYEVVKAEKTAPPTASRVKQMEDIS